MSRIPVWTDGLPPDVLSLFDPLPHLVVAGMIRAAVAARPAYGGAQSRPGG